jgi:ATP phosphoribosyltransferase regulatory subunit HisZ
MERLIQAVAVLLNEGAIEVRNMAKLGLLSLKNALGSQRELEAVLVRCVSNEKQLEKIRQMIEKNDFESISNTGSTRYGSSMRTSSLDSRSAGPYRGAS